MSKISTLVKLQKISRTNRGRLNLAIEDAAQDIRKKVLTACMNAAIAGHSTEEVKITVPVVWKDRQGVLEDLVVKVCELLNKEDFLSDECGDRVSWDLSLGSDQFVFSVDWS